MKSIIVENKHFLVIVFLIAIIGIQNHKHWRDYSHSSPYQFQHDVSSYYSYLPGLLIHQDPYFKNGSKHDYWLSLGIEGRYVTKFTMGMSLMYAPFFIPAHFYASYSDWFVADGLSYPYSLALEIGTFLYFILGLYFLMKTMFFFFRKEVVFISALLICLGSNLLYYLMGNSEMPHSYLFAIFSVILFLSHRIWDAGEKKYSYLLALLAGLAVLIRASELIFMIIPLLWNVTNIKELKTRLLLYLSKPKAVITHFIVFIIPMIPQFLYWKIGTDSMLFDPYGDEGFFFSKPKFMEFLFSYRKGWLVYSPMLLFSLLGMFFLKKYVKQLSIILPIFTISIIYILSSWWCWWFGGGLGMRAMVQYYAVLIFPFAAFIQFIYDKKYLKLALLPIFLGIVYYNTVLMRQQRLTMIHWDGMTKEAYWNMFLKEFRTQEEWDRHIELLEFPNYDKVITGEER